MAQVYFHQFNAFNTSIFKITENLIEQRGGIVGRRKFTGVDPKMPIHADVTTVGTSGENIAEQSCAAKTSGRFEKLSSCLSHFFFGESNIPNMAASIIQFPNL